MGTMDSNRETSYQACVKSKIGRSKRKGRDSHDDILAADEKMMSSYDAESNAMHNIIECRKTWYHAIEDYKFKREIRMQMELQYLMAETDNDEVELEFYDESIKEQKAVCEEAKTILKEAKAKLDEAKKHRYELITHLNNADGHDNTKNRPCHESWSKK